MKKRTLVAPQHRVARRKPVDELLHQEYSASGDAIGECEKRLPFCPMIKRLREIGAPLFEDHVPRQSQHIALRARRAPPSPQFKRSS